MLSIHIVFFFFFDLVVYYYFNKKNQMINIHCTHFIQQLNIIKRKPHVHIKELYLISLNLNFKKI